MHQQPPQGTPGFTALPEEQREVSVNLSVVSSVYQQLASYEELHAFFKSIQSEHIDLSALHSAPTLKLKKYKEAVYYGEFSSGHRQGQGIMLYQSGQRYQGDWQNDQRHGNGFEIFSNGSTYEGEYRHNKMEGMGKYSWSQGETYQGEWANNVKHGTGAWLNAQGDSYVGEWKEGTASGFGIFSESNGSRYEGTFSSFVKNGKGTQKFTSGDLYRGGYQNGLFQGQGEYFWNDGSFYKGEFKNGLKHGYGVLKKAVTGDKYEGQFIQNRKEGFGIATTQNGSVYKGNYLANLRHGQGQMYWSDGTFYKGEWAADRPHGRGSLFDGEQLIKGSFRDGEFIEREPSENEHRGISEFYLGPTRGQRRVVVTPIRKITQDFAPRTSHPRRLLLSQIDKDSKVRQFSRPTSKKTSPLRDSLVRKKLMQTTISQEPRAQQQSKSSSREKVMHSAFQVHKLYRNRVVRPEQKSNRYEAEETIDSRQGFAFGGSTTRSTRRRYFSKLD